MCSDNGFHPAIVRSPSWQVDNASHLLMRLPTSTISGDVHFSTDLWNEQLDRYAFHRATHAASTRTNRCLPRFSHMMQRTSGSSLENHFGGPILVFRSPPVYRSLLDCGLNVSPPDPPHRARAEEGIVDHAEPTPCQHTFGRAVALYVSERGWWQGPLLPAWQVLVLPHCLAF